jgi:hypothetical protein
MNLVKYVVRENNGRFSNYRKVSYRIIKKQLFVLGWVLAIFFARQNYVITCAAGGHFISKEACGEIAQAKFDSTQLAATQNQLSEMQGNLDLYK